MSSLNGVDIGKGSSDRDDGQHVDCFVLTSTFGMGTEYTIWVDKETMKPLHGEAINGEWFDIDENETSEIYAAMLNRILSDLED